MMMQNPDDTLFTDMLSNYCAPVEDAGFTQALMADIRAEERRLKSLRRITIGAACFIGGMVAATQFPALGDIIANIDLVFLSAPRTFEVSQLSVSQWTLTGMILLGSVLWTIVDKRASDIF